MMHTRRKWCIIAVQTHDIIQYSTLARNNIAVYGEIPDNNWSVGLCGVIT